jgi:hypothetical protein
LVSLSLFIAVAPVMVSAQNQPTAAESLEKLRIEAQERARQAEEERQWETKIFQVKYVDPDELRRALSMFRGNVAYSGGALRVLSVRAPKEIMPAIEDAIKRLDVPAPRKDAELTIFVVLASDQVDPSSPLPASLQPVVAQLRKVLAYKEYRLLDTLITRASSRSNNPVQLSGSLALSPSSSPPYSFTSFFQIENPDGKVPILKLSRMAFELTGGGSNSGRISGDVEIPDGQQVIVGKATMSDKAIILVMTARFSN